MPVWLSGDSATFVKWNTTPGVRVPPLAPFLVNHRHVKSEQIVCKTIVLGAVPRPVFSKGKLKNKCFKFINYKKLNGPGCST
jgi:hypothetical protein